MAGQRRLGRGRNLGSHLGYITIALLVNIFANGVEVITPFGSPDVHTVFQGKKGRDWVMANDRNAHKPGEEVPRRDMVSKALLAGKMLGSVEIEVGLGRPRRELWGVVWRVREGRDQGLLHQRPAARIKEKVIRNAERGASLGSASRVEKN